MSDQDNANNNPSDDQSPQAGTENGNIQEPSVDIFGDQLSMITNDDGTQKYQDVATALSSIPHAQSHISTLEKEKDDMALKLNEQIAANELLKKSVNNPAEQTQLSAEDLSKALDVALNAREEASTKADNLDVVTKVFKSTYGDKAQEQMATLAAANGVSPDFLKGLSETSPIALLKLAGLSDNITQTSVQKSQGSINTDGFQEPAPKQVKPVMGASTTKELVEGWNACKPQ